MSPAASEYYYSGMLDGLYPGWLGLPATLILDHDWIFLRLCLGAPLGYDDDVNISKAEMAFPKDSWQAFFFLSGHASMLCLRVWLHHAEQFHHEYLAGDLNSQNETRIPFF